MANTVTRMAYNVVGNHREDYVKVVMGAADTTGTFKARMKRIESYDLQQDGHTIPNKNLNISLAGNEIAWSGATAAHTYRFMVVGV